MTALEKLLKEVLENLGYDEICNNHSEFQERINDQVRAFQDKYSVTFRNNDSKPVKVSDEQSIGIGSTSEIRGVKHSNLRPGRVEYYVDDKEFELITDEELASKIKQELEDCGTWSYCRLGFDEEELDLAVSSIANLFKTYRTMPNSDQNNSNGK